MPKYTLKNYSEEFLPLQEKVGKEVTKEWKDFGQSSAERLKQVYSQPDFDPETRHYAFSGNDLVGFLTSKILPVGKDGIKKASLEFPLVLPGHESCADLLYQKAEETLKKKGVKIAEARVGEIWKGTIDKAKKYGYKYARDMYVLLELKVDKARVKSTTGIIISTYDHSKDFNDIVKIFVEKLNWTEKAARDNFETINKEKEQNPIHLIYRENNKIVARILASKNKENPKRFEIGTLYCENEKYVESLLINVIMKVKALKGTEISTYLSGKALAFEKYFQQIGFNRIGKIDCYEKKIDTTKEKPTLSEN